MVALRALYNPRLQGLHQRGLFKPWGDQLLHQPLCRPEPGPRPIQIVTIGKERIQALPLAGQEQLPGRFTDADGVSHFRAFMGGDQAFMGHWQDLAGINHSLWLASQAAAMKKVAKSEATRRTVTSALHTAV